MEKMENGKRIISEKGKRELDNKGIKKIENLENIICGYHLSIMRPYENLDGGYLFRTLQCKSINVQFELCSQGVFTPGSCIVKDRADPIDHPNPVRTVDTGEWLLARELLIEVPFRDDFNAVDEANVTGEDDKLLTDLINKKEPIACSNQPTLIYYLGGYSNNFDGEYDSSFAWR